MRTDTELREPVEGQAELFPASSVPRRRSAPPPDPEVPAQRTRSRSTRSTTARPSSPASSTASPARGRH